MREKQEKLGAQRYIYGKKLAFLAKSMMSKARTKIYRLHSLTEMEKKDWNGICQNKSIYGKMSTSEHKHSINHKNSLTIKGSDKNSINTYNIPMHPFVFFIHRCRFNYIYINQNSKFTYANWPKLKSTKNQLGVGAAHKSGP